MNSKLERQTSLTGTLSVVRIAVAALLVLLAGLPSSAQTFSSGSNGSDGALNLTTATPGVVGGVLIFNPADPVTFPTPLDPDGDHIYHFTTINIGAGLTVKLTSKYFGGAVYWLASGAVTINGIVDLNGEPGHDCIPGLPDYSKRRPALGGAGGWNGGIGGGGSVPNLVAQAGSGPGGGALGPIPGNGVNGTLTANQYLIPLIGGSGGSGAAVSTSTTCFGPGGGGGGGAILIASTVSITVTSPGQVRAAGGAAATVFDN
ncbi:MAG TPA: hypothetical protein VJ417_07285, partial [Candidatus Glassbacteria bacterium]|nr:hypothetical protein [Candidatus Glassbacteria bacterium]